MVKQDLSGAGPLQPRVGRFLEEDRVSLPRCNPSGRRGRRADPRPQADEDGDGDRGDVAALNMQAQAEESRMFGSAGRAVKGFESGVLSREG